MRMVLARVCEYQAATFYYILTIPFLGLCNALLGYLVDEHLLIIYSFAIMLMVQIHSACAITFSLAEWVNASLLFVPVKKIAKK